MDAQPHHHSHEPIGLLWIGDAGDAVAHFGRHASHVRVVPGDPAGMVEVLESGMAELLVLDATEHGVDVSTILGNLQAARLDTPVLLLANPGGEDLAVQAGRFAVCDCVVKTTDYLPQLLPAISQLRARHDLVALYRTNRQGQDRLRTILEFQPAVTTVITPDGIVSAMNQAGLTLLCATREQIVGRPFASLLPDDARDDATAFIRRVCQGEPADFDHLVLREGEQPLSVRTRAVPFRNADTVVALATVQERVAAPPDTNPELDALSAAALADALGEIESLRGQRDLWASERETYEAHIREAAAHADAVQLQAQAAATLHADFGPLRSELDTLRAERGQWTSEHAMWTAEREQWHTERQQLQAQLFEATGALASERSAWEQARENLAWEHQQALEAARGAREQERQSLEAQHWETLSALESERQHSAALLADLQEARRLADDVAALQQAADADHTAMLKLRDDLLRFMADADSQCRSIIEQHEGRLAPNSVIRNPSFL